MNRMQVYDLYACTYVTLNEAVTAKAVGDYIPVRSIREGKWFAVYLPTNCSHNIVKIKQELRTLIEREINTLEFTELLLETCGQVRNALCECDTVSQKEDAIDAFGLCAYTTAVARARHDGYTQEEVETALSNLDKTVLDKLEEVVPVLKVSTLLESA